MAKAKKLKSGSWRCLVYSHSEPIFDSTGKPVMDSKTKKQKSKRFYESFTADTKSEAEFAAAQFAISKHKSNYGNLTLRKAIQKYIEDSDAILSPSTIHVYNIMQKNSFKTIMDLKLKTLTTEKLEEAVNNEAKLLIGKKNKRKISPKTVRNRYGLITAVINRYYPKLDCSVKLPQPENKITKLPEPERILKAFKGDRLELAVLLAMWLSFSMSEIRGLTKSKSLDGNYLVIREVKIHVGNDDVTKPQGKVETRNRMHHIPPYIKQLIDNVDGDVIVPYSSEAIYRHFTRVLKQEGIPHIPFHGLRHLNASIMALLKIPDKYAMERGGWKSDKVMKRVYMHTFSEERTKVDDKIDNYFNSLVIPDENTEKLTEEQILKLLKSNNPDGWYNELLKFMQHEMQHEKEKPL